MISSSIRQRPWDCIDVMKFYNALRGVITALRAPPTTNHWRSRCSIIDGALHSIMCPVGRTAKMHCLGA